VTTGASVDPIVVSGASVAIGSAVVVVVGSAVVSQNKLYRENRFA